MMASRTDLTGLLVNGGRELCWFLAWAGFCTVTTVGRPFPFAETLVAFALAVLVTRLSLGHGWRHIQVALGQLAGLLAASLPVLHALYHESEPLFSGRWLSALWEGPHGVMAWLHFLLSLLLILILWGSGVALARRPQGYASACQRFDFGLAAFLVLFLLKLAALAKGSSALEEDVSMRFVYPFFLFALTAIGREQLQSASIRAFLPGYRAFGAIAGFVALVLLGAGTVLLFFQPALKATARLGYRVLAAVLDPLAAPLIAILRFLYGPRPQAPPPPEPASPLASWEAATTTVGGWAELVERVLGWGLGGLMILGLTATLVILLWVALRWLLSRTAHRRDQRTPFTLRDWWRALGTALARWRRALRYVLKGYPTAATLYGALRGWAWRSGLSAVHSETPREFGARLRRHLPGLQGPVTEVIAAYQREVYREEALDAGSIAAINGHWRLLRSPRWWPVRLRGWFRGDQRNGGTMTQPRGGARKSAGPSP